MADTQVSKTCALKGVWVRLPPAAPSSLDALSKTSYTGLYPWLPIPLLSVTEYSPAMESEQHKLVLGLLEKKFQHAPGYALLLSILRGATVPEPVFKQAMKHIGSDGITAKDYVRGRQNGGYYHDTLYTQEPEGIPEITDEELQALQWGFHTLNERAVAYGEQIVAEDSACQRVIATIRNIPSLLGQERPPRSYTSAKNEADSVMNTRYGSGWQGDLQHQRTHNRILLQKMNEEDYLQKERPTEEAARRAYQSLIALRRQLYIEQIHTDMAAGCTLSFSTDQYREYETETFCMCPDGSKPSKDFEKLVALPPAELAKLVCLPGSSDHQLVFQLDTVDPRTNAPVRLYLNRQTSYSEIPQEPGEPFADYQKRIQQRYAHMELLGKLDTLLNDLDIRLSRPPINIPSFERALADFAAFPSRFVREQIMQKYIVDEGKDFLDSQTFESAMFNALLFRSLEQGKPIEHKRKVRKTKRDWSALRALNGSGLGSGSARQSIAEIWRAAALPLIAAGAAASEMVNLQDILAREVRTLLKPMITIQGHPIKHYAFLKRINEVSTYPIEQQDELEFRPVDLLQTPQVENPDLAWATSMSDATPLIRYGIMPLYTPEYESVEMVEILCGGELLQPETDFALEYTPNTGHYRVRFTQEGMQKVAANGIDRYRLGMNPYKLAPEATPLQPFIPIEDIDRLETYAEQLQERGDTQIARRVKKLIERARAAGLPVQSDALQDAFCAGSRYGFNRNRVADFYRNQRGAITPAPDVDGTTVAQCSHAAVLFSECLSYCRPEITVRDASLLKTIDVGLGFIFAGSPHADTRGTTEEGRFRHDTTPGMSWRSLTDLIPETEAQRTAGYRRAEAEKNTVSVASVIETALPLAQAHERLRAHISNYDSTLDAVIPRTRTGQIDISGLPREMIRWRGTLETLLTGFEAVYLNEEERKATIDRLWQLEQTIMQFNMALNDNTKEQQRKQLEKMFGRYSTVLWKLQSHMAEIRSLFI